MYVANVHVLNYVDFEDEFSDEWIDCIGNHKDYKHMAYPQYESKDGVALVKMS